MESNLGHALRGKNIYQKDTTGEGEPNDPVGEHNIEIIGEWNNGNWNDVNQYNDRTVVCTYTLPAGAEETCPWLRNFEN